MSTRAKFRCERIEDFNYTKSDGEIIPGKTVYLAAVIGNSPENDAFFIATPFGNLNMGLVAPAAAGTFKVGQEYYIDISPTN